MTKHLSPEEFVDALDSTAPAAAGAHLETCESCRAELAELRATVAESREVNAAEPSPLFWDHFSARVKEATARESRNTGWSWADFGWKPLAALTVAAGALAISLYVRPGLPPDGSVPPETIVAASTPSFDEDGSWSLVMSLASELDWSEVSLAAAPAEGTADAMIEELTPAQRQALVQLLEKGIGDL